jgi:F0F1-type ATP synthase assembly protein I
VTTIGSEPDMERTLLPVSRRTRNRKILVLQTIVLILFVLFVFWLLGTVTSFTLGSMSHILVGAAIIFVVLWFTHRRNPLRG